MKVDGESGGGTGFVVLIVEELDRRFRGQA